MNSYKLNIRKILRRFLWWTAGININILEDYREDWPRYSMIGFSSILSVLMGGFGVIVALGTSLNIYYSFLIGIVWSGMLLNLNRVISNSIYNADKKSRLISIGARVMIALTITLTISLPIQFLIFEEQIGSRSDIVGKLMALNQLKSTNLSIQLTSYLITFLFFLVELIPIILHFLNPNSAYEEAIKVLWNAERVRQKIELSRLNEYAEKEMLYRKSQDDQTSLKEEPLEGFEFYIDYKSLTLSDMNDLFSSINEVYNTVYAIENFEMDFVMVDFPRVNNVEEYLRSHPEDVLLIHSIETGNSVTFKLTTGWKPKIDLIDGDFVVYLPKGSIALLITGFILTKVFDYGISSYKSILEIEKLQKEIKEMDSKNLDEQLNSFNDKLSQAPTILQDTLQEELGRFYVLTLGNSNFVNTKITPDTSVLQKIESGKYVLQSTNK